jgi:hypothetical protein
MISIAEAFEKFRQRLELSETERKDTIRRHTEVRDCIRARFDVERDFLTGSYARHTKTKPLKDVDIFFVLGQDERHRRSKPPSDILDAFQSCLAEKYGADAIEPGRRCVTVVFDKRNPTVDEEGRVLSIDAVPAFELDGCYEIPDRSLAKWIKSDPEVHKEQATKKNKSLDEKWVPLVKMIKRWNRSAGKPIKPSFLIEVMAQDLVDGPFTTYPSEMRRFFAAALDGVMQDWPDPAGLGPHVSDQMTVELREAAREAVRKAETQAALAVRLEKQNKQGEALALWSEIMGRYFPTS